MFIQQNTKKLLAVIFFFGLAGAIWGWWNYITKEDSFFPLDFMAALTIGILGGLSLTIFSKNIKKILIATILGPIIFFVTSIGIIILSYWIMPLGAILGLIISPIGYLADRFANYDISNLLHLPNPSPNIVGFWLGFLIIGFIIGLFYAFILKTKIWPLVWRAGAGFATASLVSPIIGNLIGTILFDSLITAYILTFVLIAVILGLSIFWGLSKAKK